MNILREIDIRDRMWCMALINGCEDSNDMENVLKYFNEQKQILEDEARKQYDKVHHAK